MSLPTKWGLFSQRSVRVARDSIAAVLRMDPGLSEVPPKVLFTLQSPADIAQYVVGSDADIGGFSSARLDLDNEGRGRFSGEIRTDVRPQMQGKMRSGYAGFRNKVLRRSGQSALMLTLSLKMRPSLFGNVTDDLSLYKYLSLRVRSGGDPRTRNAYFVNVQTDGPVQSDLWQHRLYLRGDGTWEDVLVPLNKFILTNSGEAVNSDMTMMKEAIRSVGISLLGGNANIQGKFELGIESISATNDSSTGTQEKQH
ncbi:hypothetical protein FRB99_005992 [Tulasnella sp. 403]|nr:hypothetical protein FRB99_005992 [Tulasnella sp. 403]